MDFYSFDAAYVERLAAGDPETEHHFTVYFSELILIKLRSHQYTRNVIEDVRQETFLRVLKAIRSNGVREPERLGAFVISVCNHIVQEQGRAGSRLTFPGEGGPDLPDERPSCEEELQSREEAVQVRAILSELSPKDRKLLAAAFLEERPSSDICKQFKVDQKYLRVLMFRARKQFRKAMEKNKTFLAKKSSWNETV